MKIFATLSLLAGLAFAAPAAPVKEVRVRVQGPVTADESSVLAFTTLKAGMEFEARIVAQDVRSLEKTGRFTLVTSTAEAAPDGVSVTYIVQPRQRLKKIRVDGADDIGNTKVLEWIALGVGDFVDGPLIEARLQVARAEYAKRYFPYARLTYDLATDAATGGASMEVKVEEGRRSKVREVNFEGNSLISARDLRRALAQKTTDWLSWISGSGTLDPDAVGRDIAAITSAYRDIGHLDVKVGEPRIDPVGSNGLHITYPIQEGGAYTVDSVRVRGASTFSFAQLLSQVRLRPGDVASESAIEGGRAAVRDYYGSRGFLRTVVETRIVPSSPGRVEITYEVDEGRFTTLRDVRIVGNARTKDKVIRREITVVPGEPYDEVKVRSSVNRLRNLNYFSYVNAFPEDTGTEGEASLVVDLEEDRTGNFITGVGFSSVENLIGFVELTQGNFNLPGLFSGQMTGGGQKLRARVQAGTKSRDLELSFVEPWFLDRKLALGVDAYQNDRRFLSEEYDQQTTGGALSLSKSLSEFWRVRVPYSLEEIRVYNVDEDASQTIKDEEGTTLESALGLYFSRDSRNRNFVPTKGSRLTAGGKYAGGPLGADSDYYELELTAAKFLSLWFDHVFSLRGSLKTVDTHSGADRVAIFNRLFMGGPRTVRAFKYRKVGPRDEDNEPIGGLSSAFVSGEYTIPVVKMIRLAAFYDAGVLNEESYDFDTSTPSTGAGIGVRFDLPQFPLQLDYAWPLQTGPENENASGRFSFFIGHTY